MKTIVLSLTLTVAMLPLGAQSFIPLWPEGKKAGSNGKQVTDTLYNERIWRVGKPGMYAFPVSTSENKGTTVLICPGGGYERLSHLYNGFNFAHWFNSKGINVFVLIYRLPHQQDLKNRQQAPLQDAQRAMRYLRSHANELHIDSSRIGVMGVSAGGHLASMLGTMDKDLSAIGDTLDRFSFHPDFMVLLSPVIDMGRYAHPGSRRNFLGADTSAAMVQQYSTQNQVHTGMPPVFMVHAQNDSTVAVKNSLLFFNALIDQKVQASLHVFPQGGHGIKLVDNPGSTSLWLDLLERWLNEKGFLIPKK